MTPESTTGVLVDTVCKAHPGLWSFTREEACRRAHHRSRWFGRRYVAARCFTCAGFHVMRRSHG